MISTVFFCMEDGPEPDGAAATTTDRERGETDAGARLALKDVRLRRDDVRAAREPVLSTRLITMTACDGRTTLQVAVEDTPFIAYDMPRIGLLNAMLMRSRQAIQVFAM